MVEPLASGALNFFIPLEFFQWFLPSPFLTFLVFLLYLDVVLSRELSPYLFSSTYLIQLYQYTNIFQPQIYSHGLQTHVYQLLELLMWICLKLKVS